MLIVNCVVLFVYVCLFISLLILLCLGVVYCYLLDCFVGVNCLD